MKRTQSNFYSMCLALMHFYTKYQEQINSNVALKRMFDEFFSVFEQMKEAIQVQNGYTSEAAKMKQKEEDEMIEATIRLACKGYVYATENQLPGLEEKLSISAWKLKRLSDVQLHTTCLSVFEALSSIEKTAIIDYGIGDNDLAQLNKEINDFYSLISQPRANIITRSQATSKIEEQIKQLKSLFNNRLDKMIESLASSEKIMKNEYAAARVTIGKSSKKEGEVEHAVAEV